MDLYSKIILVSDCLELGRVSEQGGNSKRVWGFFCDEENVKSTMVMVAHNCEYIKNH